MPFAWRVSRGVYEMETDRYLSYKRYYESKKAISTKWGGKEKHRWVSEKEDLIPVQR